ncbi:MAG: tubulin/FtsZ family protein [Halodesulfurarchaeum sp.]
MKLAVVGIGNAGGKIADRLLRFEEDTNRSLCRFVTALNTAQIDLAKLEYVPEEYRILYGQTDERSKGHGVGADPDTGAAVTRADIRELRRVLDDVPIFDVDAFLVIAGLGGGTGSGGAPVLAEEIGNQYEEPVYGMGVLPSQDEGGRASLNAARSLPTFNDAVDALVLFDNDSWRGASDSVESGYERTNHEMAKRIVTLLAAGERDGSAVSENAMDASDVRRTLATGGISSVAFAETDVSAINREPRGLLDRLRMNTESEDQDGADPATKVHGLVRRAVRSRLTIPADIESAERALLVVSGPPSEFSQKGLERARRWIETEIGSAEVLAGDDPRHSSPVLSATVLLSNVTEVPRIDDLQNQAVEAQDNIRSQEEGREEEIASLVTDEGNELDPV